MIDTIRLNLADTKIDDNSDILIQPGQIDMKTGLQSESDLFVTKSGKIIRGHKAFINNDFFNVTIYPKETVFSEQIKNKKVEYLQKIYGRAPSGEIEVDRKELNFRFDKTYNYNSKIFLQTSLPKINSYLNGLDTYNLESLNENQIKSSIRFIANALNDYGIQTDLDEANLSRIDLFNNVKTVLPFREYSEIFSHLNLSRKNLAEFAGETFLFKNKSSQFIIYNKTGELFYKHNVKTDFNYTRFENRFMNKRKVFNSFGGSHIKILLDTGTLKSEMINAGNNIFNFQKKEFEIIDQDFLFEKLELLKNSNRYWLNKFFYNEGLYSVLSRIPKSQLLIVLKELLTKDKFNKVKKELNSFDFNKSIFSNSKLCSLYDEIKGKYFDNLAAA